MDAPDVLPTAAKPEGAEPLGRVLGLDHGSRHRWVFVAAVALVVHGTAGAPVFHSFPYLTELARSVRQSMSERLRSQVDIDVEKPPPPPPPPEPEKEPEPVRPAPHAAPPPPEAAAKPPAAAEAGKVLTSEPDPNEPVDLTGDGFVTGNGDHFAGGITASRGTSKSAVRNVGASPTGTGTGTHPAPAPTPSVSLSRPAGLGTGSWGDCGFPPEADAEGINFKLVKIMVTVKPDGHARSVTVLADPGYGFGTWARQCALRKTFTPALNMAGEPVEQTTPPFVVKFER
jgi:protein TonB